MSHAGIVDKNRAFTLTSWTAQSSWNPFSMDRAEGVCFWDGDGNRFLDWSSQLVNVNIGHGNKHVIEAVREQVGKVTYAYPGIATEPRGRLGELLAELTPAGLTKSFFTLGGADGIENAMKIARLYSGRQKVLARYRSYHGGTFGAMSAGGDPRRVPNEPGVPWIVHVHDPYGYRSPLYEGRSRDDGDAALVAQIRDTIEYEGPESIAALLLEGYSGSSGVIQGGETFWRGIQKLKEDYGLVLIIDEVMSGFGRTGRWFGINHYPYVKPDVMVLAKGLTSGYVPLGAVVVSGEIAHHFEENTLWAGLTYSSHALGCAAAIANIDVYRDQSLIDRSRVMGERLSEGLDALAAKHPSIGERRGTGLHQLIELVKDRDTREPLSPFNKPMSEPMREVAASLRASGLSTLVRWNWIFNTPPLIITEDELEEGLQALSRALSIADRYVSG